MQLILVGEELLSAREATRDGDVWVPRQDIIEAIGQVTHCGVLVASIEFGMRDEETGLHDSRFHPVHESLRRFGGHLDGMFFWSTFDNFHGQSVRPSICALLSEACERLGVDKADCLLVSSDSVAIECAQEMGFGQLLVGKDDVGVLTSIFAQICQDTKVS